MRSRAPFTPGVPVAGAAQVQAQSYTPTITITGAVLASPVGQYIRLGNLLFLTGSVACTTGAAGPLSISLPAGMVLATAAGTGAVQGQFFNSSSGAQLIPITAASTTTLGGFTTTVSTSSSYLFQAVCQLAT